VLSRIRVDFRTCLAARGDVLFELVDAVLCADGPVRVHYVRLARSCS
jgi:hypothetical protein